ncbi:MAG: T9SS type A sorting domain-containing protein [Candidatus Marinimicrobia bacterium]|nr:T9SS type A sorting domain-containing protein [Candidatus Neomarinimicrobiota bacterium]
MIPKHFLILIMPFSLFAQINNFSWPMAPMNTQHRISATFDECREDRDHFHNGTDMPLAHGENVLNIQAGLVLEIGSDWIRVEDFAYVHVIPLATLHVGNSVAQGGVVGQTDSYAHVHLNYGGGASGHPAGNPLLPGKITPFVDSYHPRSPIIQFVSDGSFVAFPSNNLSGRVDIIAQAADTTDLLSSIDMNNGIYTIGWALYTADTTEVLQGPFFEFEANVQYSNANINWVYAPGSSTSIYKYIITNHFNYNGFLDCDLYPPGPYIVSVMSSDTQDNWDTTFVPIQISDIDILPPGQPVITYLGPDDNGDLHLEWTAPNDPDLAGYILEFSSTSGSWTPYPGTDLITADMTSVTVTGFPVNAYRQFRLVAIDDAPIPNRSQQSDTYGVRLNSTAGNVLIVDGFDRTNGSWTSKSHNFATYYAEAIVNSGSPVSISTASNEWVTQSQNLSTYDVVIWFVGDDSRTEETFSTAEQNIISNYLTAGGYFFASGAEIGYDLSAGSAADRAFLNQTLHLDYAGDDGNSPAVNGLAPYFSGINFSYGTTPYEEDWPDYFTPNSGGEIALQYGNSRNAAISYRNESSGTIVMGLAFETIDTELARSNLMGRVLQYFNGTVNIDDIQNPATLSISRIYPNPFNGSTRIDYQLDESGTATLYVFDILGHQVITVALGNQNAGTYSWNWNGSDQFGSALPSGAYFARIGQELRQSSTQKMLLLK